MTSAAQIVERRGARFMEAPFTGSKEAAEKGELVYYIGADPSVLQEARHLLEASSKEILEIGQVGQATAIKVATNMVTAASVQATAEALALVQATGISADKFASAMKQNASYSKTLAMKLPKMIQRDFERHFSVQHMLKDMQIATRLGLTHHLELGTTAAARDRLLEQAQRGHGDEDYSAVARKYSEESKPATESEMELFQRRGPEVAKAPPQATPARPVEPKPVEAQPTAPKPVEPQPIESNIFETKPSEPAAVAQQPASAQPSAEQPEPATPLALAERSSPPNESQRQTAPAPTPVTSPASAPAPIEPVMAAASPGSVLEALQAHMPAAPFLNPVAQAENPPEQPESPGPEVPMESAHEFLTEPEQKLAEEEEESPEARGFFSRLLRRANT